MYKSKVAILALVLILVVVSVFVFAAGLFNDPTKAGSELNSLSQQETVNAQAVNFTCHAGTEYAFEFPVRVDLSDGMDSAEATLVGTSLYEFNMKQKNYEVKETLANDDGTWTVYLLWDGNHYYNVHVNATDRTVEYDRCY